MDYLQSCPSCPNFQFRPNENIDVTIYIIYGEIEVDDLEKFKMGQYYNDAGELSFYPWGHSIIVSDQPILNVCERALNSTALNEIIHADRLAILGSDHVVYNNENVLESKRARFLPSNGLQALVHQTCKFLSLYGVTMKSGEENFYNDTSKAISGMKS